MRFTTFEILTIPQEIEMFGEEVYLGGRIEIYYSAFGTGNCSDANCSAAN